MQQQQDINKYLDDNNAVEIKHIQCVKFHYNIKFISYIVGLKPVYLTQDNQHININESIYKFLGDDIIYNYFDKFKYVHVIYEIKIVNGSWIQTQQIEHFLQMQKNKK